jgi:hypothetical protein
MQHAKVLNGWDLASYATVDDFGNSGSHEIVAAGTQYLHLCACLGGTPTPATQFCSMVSLSFHQFGKSAFRSVLTPIDIHIWG